MTVQREKKEMARLASRNLLKFLKCHTIEVMIELKQLTRVFDADLHSVMQRDLIQNTVDHCV
jgi:hypothetical protein